MKLEKLNEWVVNQKSISSRLSQIVFLYLLFLMLPMRKHTLTAAAQFFNTNTPRFSKFLKNHPESAMLSLSDLSKRQAKQFAKAIKAMEKGDLPWKIFIIVDSTLQNRFNRSVNIFFSAHSPRITLTPTPWAFSYKILDRAKRYLFNSPKRSFSIF